MADPTEIAQAWLSKFGSAVAASSAADILACLHPHGCYLRNLFAWQFAIRSLSGRDEIANFLNEVNIPSLDSFELQTDANKSSWTPQTFQPMPPMPATDKPGVLTSFSFRIASPTSASSALATGRGLVRLIQSHGGDYIAATLLLKLEDFVGFEERQDYIEPPHPSHWRLGTLDERIAAKEAAFLQTPDVLIVGGGQCGLTLAARLWQNGINALVIEKDARVGDVWRKRYPTLTLHTPANMSSVIYQPYPTTFPEFITRDRFADFLEYYAKAQEICVWTSSTVAAPPKFDPESETWRVTVERSDSSTIELRPAHLIMATGHTGGAYIPDIKNISAFRGETIVGISFSGQEEIAGKKVVVIGASNTAADLCIDFVARGAASVVMVQRSSTAVMTHQTAKTFCFPSMYPQNVSVDESDFAGESMSLGYQQQMSAQGMTEFLESHERDLLDKLEAAGFRRNQGEKYGKGKIGVFGVVAEHHGGMFLDVGCAQLIIDGKVRVKHEEVKETRQDAVVFADGSVEEADVLVFATGGQGAMSTLRHILGNELVDQINAPVWSVNQEGEMSSAGMPQPQRHLWVALGGMAQIRCWSKYLVLRIAAWKHKLL